MVNYIPRITETKVKEWLEFFPALIIVGSRQTGKTTLAKKITESIDKPFIYIDLEFPADRQKLADPYLFLKNYEDHCVILDEVQRMPEIFELLRSMIDQKRQPGRFILLGSASPPLLKQSSESLAGRVAYLHLTPFLYTEIEETVDWRRHWLRGGYPESLLALNDSLSYDWRQAFIRSYVERDLPMLGFPNNPVLARRLWQMIAATHGNLWNTSPFATSLGISEPTVKKYLRFLEQAFQVFSLQPFFANVKKRFVKSPKVYISDSGILHALLGFKNDMDLAANPLLGNSWEGYVIEQIKGIVGDDLEYFFYRTYQGTEIDLLLCSGNRVLAAIEIKYSSAPKVSKGFHIGLEDLKPQHAFVIIPEGIDYPYSKDIQVTSLSSFLKNHLPDITGKNG